jgi:thiazole synthase ThiGH ThiG subunit
LLLVIDQAASLRIGAQAVLFDSAMAVLQRVARGMRDSSRVSRCAGRAARVAGCGPISEHASTRKRKPSERGANGKAKSACQKNAQNC